MRKLCSFLKVYILLICLFLANVSANAINLPIILCQINVTNTNDISCKGGSDGFVALQGSGTSGSYHYSLQIFNTSFGVWQQIAQSPAAGAYSSTPVTFPSLVADCYRVVMTDSLGCSDTASFCLTEPTVIMVNETITSSSTSFANDGGVVLNVSGGIASYTYNWSGPNGFTSSNQNISNLLPGNYNLTVVDSMSCPYTATYVVGINQLCGAGNYFATSALCFGDSTGSIHIDGVFDVLSPTGPFAYVLEVLSSSGNWQLYAQTSTVDTFYTFNNLPANMYKLTVVISCGLILPSIGVGQPSPITISTLVTGATGSFACDGMIQSNVSGGVSPYAYLWCDGQTTSVATGMCVGKCCVIITDANACTANKCDSVGVISPCTDSIQLSVSVNSESCRGGDGSLQISTIGGNAPYYYSLDGGFNFSTVGFVSSFLIDSLVAGNYNVSVRDDSSCVTDYGLLSLGITSNPIINSVNIINESCCGNDGQLIVVADNPLAIVKYSIDTLFTWQDSAEFVGLYRGNYLVHIEDSNSCTDSVKVYLGVDSVPNINMTTQATDIVCNGDTNGTFKVYYPDSCYDYVLWRYTLFNPQIPIDTGFYFNELIKGYYGVVATSKSGNCIDSSAVRYIDEPNPITYNKPTSSAVYCRSNDLCNGDVKLDGFPSGGVPPYQYYINEVYTNIPIGPIDVDSTFFGVCSGEYEVLVLDANACVVRDTISVSDSSLYIDSFVIENSTCYGYDNGEIIVYTHGGLGAHSYLWSNGDIVQTADSLSPNNYTIIITDSVGCIAVDSSLTTQPDTLLFKIIESGKISETCMGVTYDGQIFLEITGGSGSYSYSWIGNSGVSGFGYGDTMINLTYDTILISVFDTNGCIASPSWGTINMTVIEALNAVNPLLLDTVLLGNSPMCYGDAVGTVQIDISQGVAPYQYSIDNGITQSLFNTFANLIALPYNIVVYDAFGCTDSSKVFLEEYDELTISVDSVRHVSCYGGNDGFISISASGELGGFSYLWSPTLDTSASIIDLSAVPHMVQLTDSVGCSVSDTIIIEHLTNPIQSNDLVINNTSCFGSEDGGASIQIIGGMPFENGAYTISWMNLLDDTIARGEIANNLGAGVYLVEVTDSFFCGPFIDTVLIVEPSQFYLEIVTVNDNVCFGESNGEIIVNTFGGTAPYVDYFTADSFSVVSLGVSAVYSGLSASNYALWATDDVGCISDTLFDVKLIEPEKIIAQNSVIDLSCFNSSDGKIDLLLLNGTPPYLYELLDGGVLIESGNTLQASLFVIYNLYAANYNLHITDYNDCKIDTQIIVFQPDNVVADFSVSNNMGRESFTTSFENRSLGSDAFIWNFADGGVGSKLLTDEVIHTFQQQGEYEVQLIASNSDLSVLCNDTASVIVDVEGYDIFNSFSPNSDGVNDVFHFDEWMMEGIDVEIFNRWGQKVYHWSGVDGFWDGRGYNGEKLPEAVYFYNMNAVGLDGYSFKEKGSVSLFR
jgi:gliding motility-associated-like protein